MVNTSTLPYEKNDFASTGASQVFAIQGIQPIEIRFNGAVCTIDLQRSTDGGNNFVDVVKPDFTQASFPSTGGDVSFNVEEPGAANLYRFNCPAYSSGTPLCRAGRKVVT